MTVVPDTFTTARLRLRRPQVADASAVFEYGSDPEVSRYMDWPTLSSMEDAIAATERVMRRWNTGDEYTWRITVKPDDDPVGAVACALDGNNAEIGFVLARRFWGQGYAAEAARAVLEWAACVRGVERVWASCDIDNLGSVRVLEKIGMSRETTLRKSVVRPNLPGQPRRDCLVYSWIRDA